MTAKVTTTDDLADALEVLSGDVAALNTRLDDVLGAIDEVLGVVIGIAARIEGEDE